MSRKFNTVPWEAPTHDPQPSVRRYLYLTPAGSAISDLVALVFFVLVSGIALFAFVTLVLTVFVEMSFWEAWRWGLGASLTPIAVLGLISLRLLWALFTAALERILGVDLDDSGEIGDVAGREEVRLLPVWRNDVPLINGVDQEDLVHFVETITRTEDWTQRTWRGKTLPSGRACDVDYHQALCGVLEDAGVIVGRGPRTSGELATTDSRRILRLLQLA